MAVGSPGWPESVRRAHWYFTIGPGSKMADHATVIGGHTFMSGDFRPGGKYFDLFNASAQQSGGIGGGQALGAVQANQPQFTGGVESVEASPVDTALRLTERGPRFDGLDAYTPDELLPPNKSPWLKNWNGIERPGSYCARRGTGRLIDDGTNVIDTNITAATLDFGAGTFPSGDNYVLIEKPNGDTHSFWFDTTGADPEPAGSQAADASTVVLIAGLDASSAATQFREEFESAALGPTAVAPAEVVTLTTTDAPWTVTVFKENDFTLTATQFAVTGAQIDQGYRGISVQAIELNDPSDVNLTRTTALLMAFGSQPVGTVTGDMSVHLMDPDVAWGDPEALRLYDGPSVTLSSPSAGVLRVSARYLTKFAQRFGLVRGSVRAITIAYSTQRFPRDVDARDAVDVSKVVTLAADRAAWNGQSPADFDISGLTAGTRYYVAVWGHSLEATSEPSFGNFVVSGP